MELSSRKKYFIFLVVLILLAVIGILLYVQLVKNDDDKKRIEPLSVQETPITDENPKAEFPSDFPIYPGSSITDSWQRSTSQSSGSSFVLKTQDSREAVYEFYKREIDFGEWEIQDEDNESFIMNFEKSNTQGYLVLSQSEDGNTLISITFAVLKDE